MFFYHYFQDFAAFNAKKWAEHVCDFMSGNAITPQAKKISKISNCFQSMSFKTVDNPLSDALMLAKTFAEHHIR